ncbi:MAG: C39 family peptidase [Lachnospiraceae bacterium]|nr:C39 family peptidase [Lachnospiraceae bacterium]
MTKPVDYKQTDGKWGRSLRSMGFAARVQGKGRRSYYTYPAVRGAEYGITVRRLNTANIYGNTGSGVHAEALSVLQAGNWLIACMGKGLWTSSGHYIVVYGYRDGMVYINDPASSSAARACNTWELFKAQVKYYWAVDVPERISVGGIVSGGEYRQADFVREVQMCTGAGIDGKAGKETLSKTVTVSRKKNSRHHVVLPLQKKLQFMGFYTGGLDGIAGLMFEFAVNRYQTQVLGDGKADGEVTAGKTMWKSLLEL